MCAVLLPPGVYQIAVNKYIISYHTYTAVTSVFKVVRSHVTHNCLGLWWQPWCGSYRQYSNYGSESIESYKTHSFYVSVFSFTFVWIRKKERKRSFQKPSNAACQSVYWSQRFDWATTKLTNGGGKKWHRDRLFCRYLGFPQSLSFPKYSVFIDTHFVKLHQCHWRYVIFQLSECLTDKQTTRSRLLL